MSTSKLLKIISKFRDLDPDMLFSVALVLLLVAEAGDEGLSLTEIAEKSNLGLSTVSRHCAHLGKINRHHEEGLQLIQTHEDPMERRRRLATLTGKGKAFINQLNKELA